VSAIVFSAYVVVVQAVQQFNNLFLIEQLFLSGSNYLNENRTQFLAGEILTLHAEVRGADVYHMVVYDKNGSVFSQVGGVSGSEVIVKVPLNPPSFRADESYVIVLYASITSYPIPGAFASDERIARFEVVKARTKLYLTSVYDDDSYRISLDVCLRNENGDPLAGKSVKFYLQANTSAWIRDRGWTFVTSAVTDVNGSISLTMGCRLFGGIHYMKTKFDGDSDFGKSENVTEFYTALRVPRLSITRISDFADSTDVLVKVVDEKGCPLFGKMLTVEFGDSSDAQNLHATTDGKGEVALSFKGLERLLLNQSVLRVRGDLFTSEVRVSYPTLLSLRDSEVSSFAGGYSFTPRYVVYKKGTLNVTPIPTDPYAVLPMRVNATFIGDIPSDYSLNFTFRLDGNYKDSVVVGWNATGVYRVLFLWSPAVVGVHSITIEVKQHPGGLLYNNETVNLTITSCPCNLEIYTPEVTYGNLANVTFVFSRPREYNASDGKGLFSSFNLAPDFNYTGTVHKIDCDVNTTIAKLNCNWTDTRYLRDFQKTVNPPSSAYYLSTSQGTTYTANWLLAQVGTSATWGIRVWKRSSAGAETEITSGSPVARVQRSTQGTGLQNNTWNCPSRTLVPTDSIVIRWYVGRGTNPSTWTTLATSTTERLGATVLNASIWRVVYYSQVCFSETYNRYDYSLYWGNPSVNTRILNFTYSLSEVLDFYSENGATTRDWLVDLTDFERRTYSFKLTVLDSLFEKKVVSRTVKFSRVAVNEGDGNCSLKLLCSLNVANESAPEVYVGANSTVSVGVSLFDMPVHNANASIVYAKFVSSTYIKTGISVARTLNITDGANFLRAVYIYNDTGLEGDVDYKLTKNDDWAVDADGMVNICDAMLFNATNLNNPVPPADPRADIDHDGTVTMMDFYIMNASWQQSGSYLHSFGAFANFSLSGGGYQCVAVDSGGCAGIPAGANNVTICMNGQSVGAFVLFFNATFEDNSLKPDTSGVAKGTWLPGEVGEYLLEVKLSPHFNTTVSQYTATTSVFESVCLIKYAKVVKRPVDLNVTCAASGDLYFGDPMFWASDDAYVSCWIGNEDKKYGNEPVLRIGCITRSPVDEWLRAYVRFGLSGFPLDASIRHAGLYIDGESTFTHGSTMTFGLYVVEQSWFEDEITGISQPICAQTPITTIPITNETTYLDDIDVTDAVKSWINGSSHNYGFMIRDINETYNLHPPDDMLYEVSSKESGSPLLWLIIEFDRPCVRVVVNAADPVMGGKPISGLLVQVSYDTSYQYSLNVSTMGGVAEVVVVPDFFVPLGVIYILVESFETSVFEAANVSLSYDTRWNTCLTSLEGEVVDDVVVGMVRSYSFKLTCPSRAEDMSGVNIWFFLDKRREEFTEGELLDPEKHWNATTNSDGVASFSRAFNENRTYVVYAYFLGDDVLFYSELYGESFLYNSWYKESNVSTAVVVSSIPLGVEFSVSPKVFVPNTPITLNATVMDLRYNNTVFALGYDYSVDFFDGETPIGRVTRSDGRFLLNINYPSGVQAHAYKALVVGTNKTPQTIASSPVQLTVGTETRLLLNVTRDYNSTKHVFNARLLSGSSGVGGKTIKLKLNQTEYSNTTDADGLARIMLWLSPQANNNQTSFNVVASFEGDGTSIALAYHTLPNGTQYSVCQTIQYNPFKPSSNSTSITVQPQTTTGATTLISQEQMQKNAEDSGWFKPWNQFTLEYPWYRFHPKIILYGMVIDIGFNPILHGGETYQWEGLEIFATIAEDVIQDFIIDVIGVFAGYLAAKLLSVWNPVVGIIAELVKGGIQFGLLVAFEWNNKIGLLVSAIVNIIMGLIALEANIGKAFIQALFRLTGMSATSALLKLHFELLHVLFVAQFISRWWLDLLEASIDWIIGGIALIRYFTMG